MMKPETLIHVARGAVIELMIHRFGNDDAHAPGDPFGGTTQLEQILAEIHGTFTEADDDFCPHGVHRLAPCGDCTVAKHGENEVL